MVDAKIIEVVRQYIAELRENGVMISKAYLYGSQIYGTATEESDIDLLLVSPQFDTSADEFLQRVWLSKIRTENRIEPYMVGEQRFLNDEDSPLIGIVKQDGVEIAA